ncbi:MAG: cytochrome c oxidase subunit 3 family protein [Bdellovibrionaceae bacterium]|nr:cytochrome c oxidase subunit 3 family protein [Pseudobdellovibrionaceae bacterium]MDW8189461.1 cytochrome c oxidase subunit 3 family protein [Pseudobdellovibrionaceae bacterium]
MSTAKSATTHQHHHAHHFRSDLHEFVSAKEGIWIFMVTEVLMFGGLFVAFFIYQALKPAVFAEGASYLDWKLGALNTLVLIVSSWTMALSIHYIQKGQNQRATWALITTLACGLIFMIVKYFEYTHKFEMGLMPGKFFFFEKAVNAELPLYFGFYYSMTGLHGLHVLTGMGLISWVLWRHLNGEFNEHYYTAVEGVCIFWHIVDLVWIFLFPLLYLIE